MVCVMPNPVKGMGQPSGVATRRIKRRPNVTSSSPSSTMSEKSHRPAIEHDDIKADDEDDICGKYTHICVCAMIHQCTIFPPDSAQNAGQLLIKRFRWHLRCARARRRKQPVEHKRDAKSAGSDAAEANELRATTTEQRLAAGRLQLRRRGATAGETQTTTLCGVLWRNRAKSQSPKMLQQSIPIQQNHSIPR